MVLNPDIERIRDRIDTARDNRDKYRILKPLHIDEITVERLNLGYAESEDGQYDLIVLPLWNGISRVGYYSYCPQLKQYSADIATDENGQPIPAVFNLYAITDKKALFFVSDPMDAVALEELNHKAIACDDDNISGFIAKWDSVKDKPPIVYLISWPGCDMSVPAEAMRNHGITFKPIVLSGSPFEILQADRKRIENEIRTATAEDITPAEIESVKSHNIGTLMGAFDNYIADAEKYKPIPTGFRMFDTHIGGGLWPRLYVIGAVSSLGKTTLALQMMDNVAKSGAEAIIFSLEMPVETIIARSLSRHTAEIYQNKKGGMPPKDRTNNKVPPYAFTESDILSGVKIINSDMPEQLSEARNEYVKYAAERVSIYSGRKTADEIRDIVEQHIKVNHTRPVVLIDYLQLIKPAECTQRATIREQVDYNVDVLAQMRNELKTPIIVISAFNRENYEETPTEAAFKESGGIEYTADTLITLEYNVSSDEKQGEKKRAELRRQIDEMLKSGEREIRLKFLKNRGNSSRTAIIYKYEARYNIFRFFKAE